MQFALLTQHAGIHRHPIRHLFGHRLWLFVVCVVLQITLRSQTLPPV